MGEVTVGWYGLVSQLVTLQYDVDMIGWLGLSGAQSSGAAERRKLLV